jgi:hypothetical protein
VWRGRLQPAPAVGAGLAPALERGAARVHPRPRAPLDRPPRRRRGGPRCVGRGCAEHHNAAGPLRSTPSPEAWQIRYWASDGHCDGRGSAAVFLSMGGKGGGGQPGSLVAHHPGAAAPRAGASVTYARPLVVRLNSAKSRPIAASVYFSAQACIVFTKLHAHGSAFGDTAPDFVLPILKHLSSESSPSDSNLDRYFGRRPASAANSCRAPWPIITASPAPPVRSRVGDNPSSSLHRL